MRGWRLSGRSGGLGGFFRGIFMWSSVSSRSLIASGLGLGGVPLSAPCWRVLVGSALSAGACRWRLRSSSRAFSGAVVVAGFSSQVAADAFASAWSGWCGLSLAVRRFSGRGGVPVWGVSVPVAVAPSAPALASVAPAVLPSAAWVRGV